MICTSCRVQHNGVNHTCYIDLKLVICKEKSIKICSNHLRINRHIYPKRILFACFEISGCEITVVPACVDGCVYYVKNNSSEILLKELFYDIYEHSRKDMGKLAGFLHPYYVKFIEKHR